MDTTKIKEKFNSSYGDDGGGFGGCTINSVKEDKTDEFVTRKL